MEKDYVKQADGVISDLEKNKNGEFLLSTTQIRNVLSLSAEIYNDVSRKNKEELKENLDEVLTEKLYSLKIRIVYQSGRDKGVRDFEEKASLIKEIDAVKSNEDLLKFCKYLEALVAYKKFKDPKEK